MRAELHRALLRFAADRIDPDRGPCAVVAILDHQPMTTGIAAAIGLPTGQRNAVPDAATATIGIEHHAVMSVGQQRVVRYRAAHRHAPGTRPRSEEHTSELQSLMRISYAVFC